MLTLTFIHMFSLSHHLFLSYKVNVCAHLVMLVQNVKRLLRPPINTNGKQQNGVLVVKIVEMMEQEKDHPNVLKY